MDMAKSPYYRHSARLLKFLGQWPYQSSMWNRLRQFSIHLIIITAIIVEMIKMFQSWGNADIMIECFAPMGTQALSLIKSINSMINQDKIRSIADHLQDDWATKKTEKELTILRKFAKEGRKASFYYALLLLGSLAIYLLLPMMPSILNVVKPLNVSRQRAYLYPTEYYVDAETYFWWIALHTYSSATLAICTAVAVDTMFTMYVQHVCGLLAIASERLKKTAEDINLKTLNLNVPISEDYFYEELIICIEKQQDAINLATLIESSFSSGIGIQLVLGMFLVSISLLQVLTKLGSYDEMWRMIQFYSAQLFHVFFISLPGQKLINQSIIFSEAVYYSGWHGFSFRCRTLVKIMMMGTAKPNKITAYKFYELSMENFRVIFQTSLSYFTTLASLR